uniref:Uncharacterized protein n=1 Tax=Romanomermis culicivorax TaxID=13658 RepID=A0A915K526_ROMCU
MFDRRRFVDFLFNITTCRNKVLVCGHTPSTASITIRVPSQILVAVETSPQKSTCPGESTRFIKLDFSETFYTYNERKAFNLSCICSIDSSGNSSNFSSRAVAWRLVDGLSISPLGNLGALTRSSLTISFKIFSTSSSLSSSKFSSFVESSVSSNISSIIPAFIISLLNSRIVWAMSATRTKFCMLFMTSALFCKQPDKRTTET